MGRILKPDFALAGPDIIRGNDILTILGCGDTLWLDVEKYGVIGDVMAVSDTLAYYDRGLLQHAVSRHHDGLTEHFLAIREKRYQHLCLHENIQIHGIFGDDSDAVTHRWTTMPITVDSGQFATLIGVCMGYEEIRLLGMPLEGGRFFRPERPGQLFDRYATYHKEWRRTKIYMGNVRSAGGFTADLLGRLDG